MKKLIHLLSFLVASFTPLLFSGCSDDPGDDIEEAGENLKDAAEEGADNIEDAVN